MLEKKRQTVIPTKKDVPVFNPETSAYLDPEKGAGVKWRTYWKRRLKEGVIKLGKGPIADKQKDRAEKIKILKEKAEKEAAENSKADPKKKKGGNK